MQKKSVMWHGDDVVTVMPVCASLSLFLPPSSHLGLAATAHTLKACVGCVRMHEEVQEMGWGKLIMSHCRNHASSLAVANAFCFS